MRVEDESKTPGKEQTMQLVSVQTASFTDSTES
jgi:hypothetical protein